MIHSPERDPMVEFVVEQLKRVRWIYGHSFVDGDGYLLDWSPEGGHRMMLLQIALKGGERVSFKTVCPEDADPGTRAAVADFWDACVAQLSLEGEQDSLPAFVKIIGSWRQR